MSSAIAMIIGMIVTGISSAVGISVSEDTFQGWLIGTAFGLGWTIAIVAVLILAGVL